MDPIADMLIRIKNGQAAGRDFVNVPCSVFKKGVLQVMLDEGYIKGFEEKVDDATGHKNLVVQLKYLRGMPVIKEVKKVSKPGCRIYSSIRDLRGHYNNLGTVILSTSAGIMSDAQARKRNMGGEVICKIF